MQFAPHRTIRARTVRPPGDLCRLTPSTERPARAMGTAAPHAPDFRLTWFCGMMIWHELASFVFLIGWLRMQMTRITWPTFVTRSET